MFLSSYASSALFALQQTTASAPLAGSTWNIFLSFFFFDKWVEQGKTSRGQRAEELECENKRETNKETDLAEGHR